MSLQRDRVDLGSGKEGQQDRADAGEQRRVVGLLHVSMIPGMLPNTAANQDLYEGTEIPTRMR